MWPEYKDFNELKERLLHKRINFALILNCILPLYNSLAVIIS